MGSLISISINYEQKKTKTLANYLKKNRKMFTIQVS